MKAPFAVISALVLSQAADAETVVKHFAATPAALPAGAVSKGGAPAFSTLAEVRP